MKIAIGSDHAGFELKAGLSRYLESLGHDVCDYGTSDTASVDYPDFAAAVAGSVACGEAERGILICGTGIGMSMAANKIPGIRAALCNDLYTARMSRLHNDANVLCMGSRVIGAGLAREIVDTWITTPFEGARHS